MSVFVRACVLFFVLVLASCEEKKPPDKALITRQQQGDQVNHKVLILISFILEFHKGFGNAELHPSVLDFSRLLPSTTSFPSRDQQGAAAGHGEEWGDWNDVVLERRSENYKSHLNWFFQSTADKDL